MAKFVLAVLYQSGNRLKVFSNPEGIQVNSRWRALRDAHGSSKKRILTLKGSNPGPRVRPFQGQTFFCRRSVGVAKRLPTAINLHPSGMMRS